MLSRSTQLVFMNYLGARPIYANGGTPPFFLSFSLFLSVLSVHLTACTAVQGMHLHK